MSAYLFSAENQQFVQTYNMFCDYFSGHCNNMSYAEWVNSDPDDKAALLYVIFYKEVTLAWCNAIVMKKIVYVSQDDGVSTVLQYLMKNVDKISEDPDRFTPNYIYTVCYNCLLSLWKTRSNDMQRSISDISNEYIENDKEVNLWDLVPSEDDDMETRAVKEAIENIIRHMGPKAEKVVNHLINPGDTLHKISKSSSERPIDRLADVSVSNSEYEEIISELKIKLAPYKDLIYNF